MVKMRQVNVFMKIGILTFHRAVNYGAVLQAYALQHSIEKMGHKAEIIDYRSPFIETSASPFLGFKQHNSLIASIKQFIFRSRKNVGFHFFFLKYIKLSKKACTEDDLVKLSKIYDCIFTGSDQVWNLGCSGDDKAYFLGFVDDKSKKNSYAASFGGDKIENKSVDYRALISDYNSISVRERSGASIVKEVSNREAAVVLDPTLLLSEEEWKQVIARRPIKDKYIFVYYLREPKDLKAYVEKLSKKTGYKVIDAKSSIEFFLKNSPADFLSWIYYSEYFITNSFHGTVFSLIFKKKFVVELQNKHDINSRSKELLEMVNIDRDLNLENLQLIDEDIDYSRVRIIIEKEREKSVTFIRKAMRA